MIDRNDIVATGLWAWLDAESDTQRGRVVARLATQASSMAWDEFVAGKLPKDPDGGLKMRFSPRAWDLLGLTARSGKYERYKQKKMGGRNLPYTSPRKTVHMRDMLGVKGAGYSVRPIADSEGVVTTQLNLPGARILNAIKKPWGAIYRQEFLQLARRAKHQADAVVARALEILLQLLRQHIAAQPPQRTVI